MTPTAPAPKTIVFQDGAAYERAMGIWSRLAGTVFLDWLAPAKGQRWADIGCGNGAFTELLAERCAPSSIHCIDPSEHQLAFARTRPALKAARLQQGDAMALPFDNAQFDAAVMALVIFFVPDPRKGVAEMLRVVRPGGLIAAYAWDITADVAPFQVIRAELVSLGVPSPLPPSADISRLAALHALWADAGLKSVETREIVVERTYRDFEDFWQANMGNASLSQTLATLAPEVAAGVKDRVRAHVPADAHGRVTWHARANAVRGWLPQP